MYHPPSLGLPYSGNREVVVASKVGNDIKREENWTNCGSTVGNR